MPDQPKPESTTPRSFSGLATAAFAKRLYGKTWKGQPLPPEENTLFGESKEAYGKRLFAWACDHDFTIRALQTAGAPMNHILGVVAKEKAHLEQQIYDLSKRNPIPPIVIEGPKQSPAEIALKGYLADRHCLTEKLAELSPGVEREKTRGAAIDEQINRIDHIIQRLIDQTPHTPHDSNKPHQGA